MAIGYLVTTASSSDRIQNTTAASWSTGVIEWRGCVAMDNWEPGSFRATALGHHRGQFTFRVRGGSGAGDPGNPDLAWHDGSSLLTIASNAQLPDGLTAYQWVWLRYVFNVNNGSNRVCDFYYSLDPETTAVGSVTWTQIGTQVSAATSTIRAATSSVVGVGGDSTMTGSSANSARYAFATLTLNGTLIHDPDLRTGAQGWASPPATDGQGNSWAFNGSASWQAPTTTTDTVDLYVTADGTITDVVDEGDATSDLFASIDDDPGSPSDGDWNNNTDAAGQTFYPLTDMPSDFDEAQSATIIVRYRGQEFGTGTVTLYARLYQSDETTPLSDEVEVVDVTADTSFANTSAVTLTGIVASDKTTWDGARLRLRWATT